MRRYESHQCVMAIQRSLRCEHKRHPCQRLYIRDCYFLRAIIEFVPVRMYSFWSLDVWLVVDITTRAGPAVRNSESRPSSATLASPTFMGFGDNPCATRPARKLSDFTVSFGFSLSRVCPPTNTPSDAARS